MSKVTDTHMLFVVQGETPETRKQVEELKNLLNEGWEVATTFSYKEEVYYLLYKQEEEIVN